MLHRLPQFQILLPSCHLHFFLRPAIHAATHENLEAYRRPAKSLDAMRGLHAKIVLSSTTHTHRELTSSTLLQKHARLNLALRRSLALDHRKLVHFSHPTTVRMICHASFSFLVSFLHFFGRVFKAGFFAEFEGNSSYYSINSNLLSIS
jgi:hypothetical protein